MGVRLPTVFTVAQANALPASAAETVLFVLPPISQPIDGAEIFLYWQFSCTAGTGMTSAVVRLRYGTTTGGTLVSAQPFGLTTVAGNFLTMAGWYPTAPGVVAGQQFCLTVVQTAATAASTAVDGALLAMVL